MSFTWTLILIFLKDVIAQDITCNFYQSINANTSLIVTSPNYPDKYTGAQSCRWIIDCPKGYNCRLDCPEISLPSSIACMLDKFLVSNSGDPLLVGAATYCGKGSLSVVSTRQRISIGLLAPRNTNGGRFQCDVWAQPVATNSACSCGVRRRNRIVGGEETGVNEFPMMVALVDRSSVTITCGGVIISNWYVLTAAHCLKVLAPNTTVVVVGVHNITNNAPATKGYRVAKYNIHPLYNEATYDYDIGIITTTDAIEYSERVGPVCLPFKYQNQDFSGKKVTVLGWGTTFFGGPTSSVLLEADLDVIPQMKCMFQQPSVTSRQICTLTKGKDACQYDSGGPLLYTDPETALLFSVGIISSGRFCADTENPGINTRVTSYLDWIVSTTKVSYCIK